MAFEIKRGMCFFIEKPATSQPIPNTSEFTPEKNRPYMVVSNNKCNASSSLIHVAPVIHREYNEKHWWNVPFKSTCNKPAVVNISEIMLIDKNLCTTQNYAMSLSDLTVNNTKLLSGIAVAIRRQFGLDNDSTKYERYEIEEHEPIVCDDNNSTDKEISMPTFNITINLNGLPIGVNATTDISVDKSSVVSSGSTDTDKPVVTKENTTEKKIAKAVPDVETSPKKIMSKSGVHFSNEEKKRITEFIKKNYRAFGGNMTLNQIAESLGIGGSAAFRYVKAVSGVSKKSKTSAPRVNLPDSLNAQFMSDYVSHGTAYIIQKYSKYGFTNNEQVYRAVAQRKKMLKGDKSK